MDVAALEFTKSTDVNESLTMGYKDGALYCVAPIVTAGPKSAPPPAFYEFWAVGASRAWRSSGNHWKTMENDENNWGKPLKSH